VPDRAKPPRRVAFVTPYWYPILGGPTTYVAGLAAELRDAHGIEVLVLAREGSAEGAEVVGGTRADFSRKVVARLEGFRPEVVHAHAHWYALQAALRYRARHRSTRVVFTLHTAFPSGSPVRRAALARLLSRADFVTAVSRDLLETTLRDFRFDTRVAVTRPGTSLRAASAAAVSRYRKEIGPPSGPLVTFLGQLVYGPKSRGVGRLIEAMARVRAVMPEAVLVVLGDGPHRASLESQAARTVPGGARFLGAVLDVAPALGATSVYAHISLQEGLPLAILEAMACGAPVVATDTGGIPEVVREGRTGFLVRDDPAEIADRILRVLKDPGLAQALARSGKESVAEDWRWPRAAQRILPVYGLHGGRRRIVLTADLERDFAAATTSHRGMDEGLPALLDLLHRHGMPLHSFATSDLADRYADVLRGLLRRGDTLGCHAESHDVQYLSAKPLSWQREMIARATRALEKATGMRPDTFRAPNFSANGATIRALAEAGYRVDASVLPGRVVRRGRVLRILDFRTAPREPYFTAKGDPARSGDSGVLEVPVTENPDSLGGPIGLGYLNSYGVDATLDAIARSVGDPTVFLIHPWEFVDPPAGRVPEWMRQGCRTDVKRFDAFLTRLGKEHEVITLGNVVDGLTPRRSRAV